MDFQDCHNGPHYLLVDLKENDGGMSKRLTETGEEEKEKKNDNLF